MLININKCVSKEHTCKRSRRGCKGRWRTIRSDPIVEDRKTSKTTVAGPKVSPLEDLNPSNGKSESNQIMWNPVLHLKMR